MHKKQILLATIVMTLLSMGMSYAYAVEPEETVKVEIWHHVLAGVSFVTAGIFYSSSGWIKRVRRTLVSNGNINSLDYKKMGKSILIGVILGSGAMIYSMYIGDHIVILNAEQFFVQVGLNTAAILLIDKWILGRVDTEEKAGPTGDDDEDDFDELEKDLPVEVPPGKDI